MPAANVVRRPKSESLVVPALRILSSSVAETERVAFIKSHIRAIELCGRRTIHHAWLAGRELIYIKEQRADLRGRAWVAFIKKHFDLGERQAYDIMRVNRAFPSLKAFPKGIESVRGAISHLQANQEVDEATKRADGRTRESRILTNCNRQLETETLSEVEVYRPSAALPASARTRDQLRTAQKQLAEIAASDAAAFKKVRAVIQQQHARIQASAKRKTSKKR
jgi:hypothetical protein